MRRILPLAVILALAACTAPSASVTETPTPVPARDSSADPAGPREATMRACDANGTCQEALVHFTRDVANVMRVGADTWLVLTQSDCRGGTCAVVDQHGTAWTLQP